MSDTNKPQQVPPVLPPAIHSQASSDDTTTEPPIKNSINNSVHKQQCLEADNNWLRSKNHNLMEEILSLRRDHDAIVFESEKQVTDKFLAEISSLQTQNSDLKSRLATARRETVSLREKVANLQYYISKQDEIFDSINEASNILSLACKKVSNRPPHLL